MSAKSTSPNWVIRPATPADYPRIRLMNAAIQQYELDLVGHPMLDDKTVLEHYFIGMLAAVEQRDGIMLVADCEAGIIAFAVAYKSSDDDDLVDPAFNSFALLSDLYVDAECRGQGIAQSLMAAISDIMKSKGCTWLRICAKANNQLAISPYQRFGFSAYETVFIKPL